MIAISNLSGRGVVPAYTDAQVAAMLAGDFSNSDPTYVDAKTGQPLEPAELKRRLARASVPVFATKTAKVDAALAAHKKAQALMGASASAEQTFTNRLPSAEGTLVNGVFKLGGRA